MRWAIFQYVKVAVASGVVALIFSTSANAWSTSSPPEFIDSDIKVFYSYPCQGTFGTITLDGNEIRDACIMGENVKVAWYLTRIGTVAYAISFPLSNTYYHLDVCGGTMGCVYAEQTNTFLGFGEVYQNFVSTLEISYQNGTLHYAPRPGSSVLSLGNFEGQTFTPQTIATSRNGKWALLEVRDYGIFRIDNRTLDIRRVVAPGISYGYGSDPRIEMTISNDGSTIALVGTRMSISIILVNDTCGDKPNAQMKTYYTGTTVACAYVPTPSDKYIADFRYAVRPIFSNDDKTLSFDAFSYNVAGRHFTLFEDSKDKQDRPHYLALGDSFTSGEGEIDNSRYLGGSGNKCHVSNRSYPFLLGASWDMSVYSTACSGATMQSARGESAKLHQPNQLTELENRPAQLATVGIGGNDAGLIGKLKDCLGIDTCKWAGTSEYRQRTAMEIKQLFPHLKDFYADMKVKTLGPVIVVGYPRIITANETCSSGIGLLLNQTERVFMNEAIHYLNQVIQAAANDIGVEYADVEEVLNGGELCSLLESPYMNAIHIGDDYPDISILPFLKVIGAESFHPKPAAHAKVATRVFETFPDLSNIPTYMNNGNPTVAPAFSSYWDSIETNLKPQKAVPFLKSTTIAKKGMLEIFFPAFTFKPLSNIVLELHSEVKNLGTVKSSEDGSLAATISTDDFELGFHSVHAIGNDFANNDIDTYDFLEVFDESEDTTVPIVGFQTGGETVTADSTDNILSDVEAFKPPQSESFSGLSKGYAVASVLGASTAAASYLLPVAEVTNTFQPLKSKENDSLNWSAVVVLMGTLIITAVWLFANKRQKQPGNPT